MKKPLRYFLNIIVFILIFITQIYIFFWIACEVPTSGITKNTEGIYNSSYKGGVLIRQFSFGFIFTSIILTWYLNKFINKK